MTKNIYVVSGPLSQLEKNTEWLDRDFIPDPTLVEVLMKYKEEELEPNNIEIFEIKGNCIIAEDGYYIAVYEDQIKAI